MGGADKALLPLDSKPLIAHVIERLQSQVDVLAISANGDPARFAAFGLPVLADSLPVFPGPLAGLLAGLDWAKAQYPDSRWLLTAPCDCPFLPAGLAEKLLAAARAENADLALASSQGRRHPAVGMWGIGLSDGLKRFLATGERKMGLFAAGHKMAVADFPPGADGRDPFQNLNTPQDLKAATSG